MDLAIYYCETKNECERYTEQDTTTWSKYLLS